MNDTLLKNFYTNKYSKEEIKLEKLKYQKYPTDRINTAFKYFIDKKISGNILEIGIGSGILAYSLLNSNLDIKNYVGIELSESRAKKLKSTIKDKRISIINGNIEEIADKLMFDFGKFDWVIMIALIEHLIDPLNTMLKIKRNLLNPHGKVYINTPNIADYGSRKKLLLGQFPSTASKDQGLITYDDKPVSMYDQGHLHYFTFYSLKEMLRRYCEFNNFEIVPQPIGKLFLGKKIHFLLAKWKPSLFSELNLVAW